MYKKPILNLNLNYAHKNLSAAFRIISGSIGSIAVTTGIISFSIHANTEIINVINAIICIAFGGGLTFIATKFLPNFLKRFFLITDEFISYKTNIFFPKKTYKWDNIEEVEIDKTLLKLRVEQDNKHIIVYLGVVSYQDFELLQKAIVDICMEKEIDIK